ncbi:discoidin domain-containing protein [Nocardia colli]|uniref:discoidin domain-containing protein n=1 Tax=Nocardia colli TaxID=2545717 RepID=UPI0035D7D64D
MLDEEPQDLFLRHRAAVLATLFGAEDEIPEAPDQSPESGATEQRSSSAATDTPAGSSQPADPGRIDSGPTASQRINALLGGRPGTRPTAMGSLPPPREPVEPAEPRTLQQRPTPQRRPALPPVDQLAHEVLRHVRKPKVALAAIAAIALVIVLVLVSGNGRDDRPPDNLVAAAPNPSSGAPPTSAAAGPSDGANIKVASAEATCPPGSTPGMDAFDGRPATAWSCVRAFNVDGQVLRVDLGQTYTIDAIGLVPGWDYIAPDNTDQWSRYRTVARVSYRFNDDRATTFTQRTLDQRKLVLTKIDPPVKASQVVLTVLQSSGGSGADATAISTIVIHGH